MQKILLAGALNLPEDVIYIVKKYAFQDATFCRAKKAKNRVMQDIQRSNVIYSRTYERFTWENEIPISSNQPEEPSAYKIHITSRICKCCGDFIEPTEELARTNKSCFCSRDIHGLLWNDPDDRDDDDDGEYHNMWLYL